MAGSDRNVAMAAKQAALKAFGARLQEARSNTSLTQEDVADKLTVSTQTVRNWEAGRTEPSRSDKERLASLYNKPVESFFGAEAETPPEEPEEEEEDIDINDPSLSLFFRGEWDEFTEAEKQFVREAIRDARAYLKKRNEMKGRIDDRS